MTDTDRTHFDIVIAGGSFIGLALARALVLSSGGTLRVAVVDPVALETHFDAQFDSRASALSVSTKQFLDVLGVWDGLKEFAQPATEIEITDSKLENVLRPVFLHLDNVTENGEASTYFVENYRLRQALTQLVAGDEAISFFGKCTVTSFSQKESVTHVHLSHGQSFTTSLLVAADGRRSRLRKQAGLKTIGWSYNQTGLVTTVAHSLPHDGRAVQHFLPSGPFARLPLTEQRCSLVWSERTPLAKQIMALDDAAFLGEIEKRFGSDLGDLSLAGPRGSFPLNMHLARSYVAERFALIGDAAHGVHPIAGLGLNMGVRDVAALTEVIVEASRVGLDFGSDAVLQRYVQWRRADNMLFGLVMDSLNRLFSNDFGPLRTIRDVGLGLVNRSDMLKSFFVREASGLSGHVPRLLKGEMV